MDRYRFVRIIRFLSHLHYRVSLEGMEHVLDGKVHLIMPNHPAYIDPVVLCSECWQIPLRPMAEDWIFRNKFFAYVLHKVDALEVPNVAKVPAEKRAEAAEAARKLGSTAIELLAKGDELCFYPAGHVTLTEKEEIGNRRLAYEVCSQLPEGVEILLAKTTGLEHSYFSHLKTNFRPFRKVHIKFVVMTDEVKEWAKLDKKSFNEKLEEWYNEGYKNY